MNNYGLGILIQAKDQASAVFQKVERNFDSLSKKSDLLASRMQASSKAFYAGIGMMGAGATLLGGVAATIKVAGDFQEAMIGVQKTSGMTDAEIKQLGDRFVEMSSKMPNSAKELANIGEIGGQLGIVGVENLSSFTDTVAKLASVSEFSAEEGGAALAKIANQFKIPIKQAKNMGSVLNELSNISTATAPTIAELTSRMAGAGASLGLTMPQISAIGAALTDMGVSSEVGGTAMSDMFMEMMKRTDQYAKVAGVSTAEFKQLIEKDAYGALTKFATGLQKFDKFQVADMLTDLGIGGARGTDVLLKLVEANKSVNGQQSLLGRFVDTSNKAFAEGTSLQREYDNSLKGMNAQLKIAWNSVVALAIEIGQEMVPYITKAAKAISSFVQGIKKWSKEHPGALRGIVLLVAALGGLLFVGGAILTFLGAIGMLSVGLSALPAAAGALGGVAAAVWPVIAVIAAMIAAGVAIYYAWKTNFGGIRDFIMPIWKQLQRGFQNFVNIVKGVTALLRGQPIGPELAKSLNAAGLMKTVQGIANFLKMAWSFIKGYVAGFISAVEPVYRNLFDALKPIVKWIVEGFKIAWNAIGRFFALFSGESKGAGNSAQSFGKTLGQIIGFIVTLGTRALIIIIRVLTFILPIIGKIILFIFKAIVAIVKFHIAVARAIAAAIVWVWNFGKAVWNGLVTAWNTAGQWISTAIGFISNLISTVIQWILFRWQMFKQGIVLIWTAISFAVSTVMNYVGQIISTVLTAIQFRWQQFRMFITMLWQAVSMTVMFVVNTIRGTVMAAVAAIQFRWQQFRGAVAAVWNSISATVSGVIAGIQSRVQAVITFITGLWNGLKAAVSGVWNSIVGQISGAVARIRAKLIGLIPDWLRTALSYIGINIPTAPKEKGKGYATGGYVAKTGGISATLHEGEVITPAPAVQKIVRFADMIPASGIGSTQPNAPASTTISNHISISLPNVKEIDRQSVEELAELIIRKIEYLQKRKREAGFSNDFNPSLAVART
ncbi:MAG: Phage-related minor tail protein [bacterium ADurb.Bin236]|nr:MAG: Phage-related minor tail protein [bacterium ADurb.Bin236]HOY63922.1 phage tail tape measure protein [bacterium]